jgi:dolichol kinase
LNWKIDPQWRTKLVKEIRRKLIHLTGLLVPLSILAFGKTITAILIALALLVALILEAGRLNGRISLPEVRDKEKNSVAGYIYYILGSLLTVIIFEPMIAVTSMLMLSLGDAVSGIVGSILERANVRDNCASIRLKPLPIVVSMFLVCLAIGFLSSTITQLPFRVYFAGAVGATVADSLAVNAGGRTLDDNLIIPLLSGFMMSLAFRLG